MTIVIRALTIKDFEAADRILQSAFGSPESRQADLRRYLSMQPDGWFIATNQGEQVGMVGAVDFGSFAYVGMMAVLTEMRHQGIGRALMEHLLDWLDERDCPMALLDATEAGAPLYEHLGFIDDGEIHVFHLPVSVSTPYPAGHVSSMGPHDLPALVDFDTPIFGADRGKALSAYLADFPTRSLIARDEIGRIGGFLFAQMGRIGPWAAVDPATAEDLIKAALSLPYEWFPRVNIPSPNQAAVELLKRYGFQGQYSLRLMRRGGSQSPGDWSRIYAQASSAIG
jgi:predicted N-acetyltransferase YhbS